MGADEGRPTQGTPTTGTQGDDRVRVRGRERVARDNGASVGRGHLLLMTSLVLGVQSWWKVLEGYFSAFQKLY